MEQQITTLFLDIGGVLLTSGWDHNSRDLAASGFNLDKEEMEDRHHLNSALFDAGMLSLDEYLNRVIFHQKRIQIIFCILVTSCFLLFKLHHRYWLITGLLGITILIIYHFLCVGHNGNLWLWYF